MTNKEKEAFELIRQNPQITQNELAEQLGITRSSVSVHITNLMKKGYIAGRGYILNDSDYVVVIGAANMDIIGLSHDSIIKRDSNPGKITFCPGGVSRNIAENLARLQVNVKMISAICDDSFGKTLTQACQESGIDMNHIHVAKEGITSTYMAVIDKDGDMNVAISDMTVLDHLPVEHIQKKRHLIERAQAIVMDACLPEDVVEYLLSHFKDKKNFMDPVSIGKAKKIKDQIGRFHTIKCNMLEAEFLTGQSIKTLQDCERAGDILLNKGVQDVFISLGAKGVYYQNRNEKGRFQTQPIKPVNATGAGDAFMAGIVYGSLQNMSMEETARFATCMSLIALKSEQTVSTLMSKNQVVKEMNIL